MLLNIEKYIKSNLNKGFTLVELLVAVAIIGIISTISVQSLYDAVSIRSKQHYIEDTSDDLRSLVKLVTNSILEGNVIKIPNSREIMIVGDSSCATIKFDAGTGLVLHSRITGVSCTPPTSGFTTVSGNNIEIEDFSFSPVSNSPSVITLRIIYKYVDASGNHPFTYQTTITPRV